MKIVKNIDHFFRLLRRQLGNQKAPRNDGNFFKQSQILILFCAVLLSTQALYAKDIKFEASIDRAKIALGDKAQLGLTFYETQNMPAPDIANLDGFEVRYIGPSTMMTVINGRVSSSITHMYTLQPLRLGRFQLGPFEFKFKGNSYASNVVSVDVAEEKAPQVIDEPQDNVSQEDLKLGDRIFLNLNVDKASAYINELIPVTVKLYVNRLNVSDIQLPTFAQEGFSKVEFKEPKQFRENVGGLTYDVLEFKTQLFGTRPGEYKLGPANIKCNVVVKRRSAIRPNARMNPSVDDSFRDSFFDDFFTRYERHPVEIKSPEVPIVISPLPVDGRPAEFLGAVGDYQFIFNVSPKKVRVGDPITLTMEINGTGNFNTVLIPKLDSVEGFKAYEPQIQTEEQRKTFKQVIIPESESITETPKAVFTYFDPAGRIYKRIQQGPVPIVVEKGKEEAPSPIIGPKASSTIPAAATEETLRDIVYIKEAPGRFLKKEDRVFMKQWLLPVLAVSILSLLSFYLINKRKRRIESDTVYAGRLTAYKLARKCARILRKKVKNKDTRIFYEALFTTLQDYLGNRLNIPPRGITSDIAESFLAPKGVELDVLRKVRNLFDVCDQARFASQSMDEMKMHSDIKELEDVIKYFERMRI